MNEKQKFYLSELQKTSVVRGGKCLSDEYITTATKYRWECGEGHIWEATGNKIQQGRWCPYCAGRYRDMKYVQNIAKLHGGEVLDFEFHGMGDKYLWKCKSGHEWKSKLDNVVHLGRWCPYCAGNPKDTIEHMHKLACQKNGECLSVIYNGHGSHLLWKCTCGYQWKCTPKNIKKGRWCPKCSGNLSPTIEEAQKLAISRDGKLLSLDVRRASDHLKWECIKGHIWKATWSNIKNKKSWCPHCNNFLREGECREILETIFGKQFPKDRKILNCRLELDGYCGELKLAFEYNGKQHYDFVEYWHKTQENFKKAQARDIKKARLCKEKGIKLIVIPYTENHRLEDFIEEAIANSV